MATDTITDTSDINEAAAELATAEQEIAQRYGFKAEDSELFFAKGTKFYDDGSALDGHRVARKYADEYAALPSTADAALVLTNTIAAEQRRDRQIDLGAWKVDDAGKFLPRAPLDINGQ